LKHLFLFAAGIALAHAAFAQELVKIETRPGVTQSFLIPNVGKRQPDAAALLLAGGGGNINLRHEDGAITFRRGNFLPRSRGEFIRNGILPVLIDNPSDQAGKAMSDEFRRSAEHAIDMRAVRAELKKRYPELPVFLAGTSRSTISVANLAAVMDTEIAGVVLSSSVFYAGGARVPSPLLLAFNWSAIKVPLLFVHHVDDQCRAAPYEEAERLGRRFALITVRGGKRAESGPCDPLSAHGFFGKEPETVAAIAAWMLARPFAREIQ
jgi:hypothetical protein